MKKWLYGTLIGGSATLVTAGAVIGITLPVIMKYKAGIANFIPHNGHWNPNLSKKAANGEIKYVALGDSESAGYNELMGGDYLSFADFFAKDLQKAGALSIGGYSNYAVSGAEIDDTHQLITRNPSIMSSLGSADIITITVGANDLLSYAKLCDAQFGTSIAAILGFSGNPTSPWRKKQFPDQNPGDPTTVDSRWGSLNKTVIQASRMFKENNFAGLISMEPKLLDIVYQAIQRDLLFLLRDLGAIAPHADVIVAAHAFPFINMPNSAINGPIPEVNNTTVVQNYSRYIGALKNAVNMTPYARFVDFNKDIPAYDNDVEGQPNATDQAGKTITDRNDPQFRYRKMPNIIGIHPSTYGHQLLGNGLFKNESALLGISNYKDFYTYSTKATESPDQYLNPQDPHKLGSQFQRFDEGIYARTYVDRLASTMLKGNKTRNLFSELFNAISTKGNLATPESLQQTSYAISSNPKDKSEFVAKKNGTLPPQTPLIQQVTEGLFGTKTLGLNMTSNIDLMKLTATIGINMSSAIEEGHAKPTGDTDPNAISPLDFIKKQMVTFKQTKELTKTQNTALKKATNDQLTKSGGFNIGYNSKTIDGKDISSMIPGVTTFGEAVGKYNETNAYNHIKDYITAAQLLFQSKFQQSLSLPLSLNNGQYFLDTLKQLGETKLLSVYTPLINTQRTLASNNTALKTTVTKNNTQLVKMIDQLNTSINSINKTNANNSSNNIWNKVANHTPSTVADYINGLISKVSQNKESWNAFESATNLQGKSLKEVQKVLSSLITEFSDVESFSKANIQSSINDTVLSQTMADTKNKTNNPTTKLLGDMISVLTTIFPIV